MKRGIFALVLVAACSSSGTKGGGGESAEGTVTGTVTIDGADLAVKGCTAESQLREVSVHFALADGRRLTYSDDRYSLSDGKSRGTRLACRDTSKSLETGSRMGGEAFAKGELEATCTSGATTIGVALGFECGKPFTLDQASAEE